MEIFLKSISALNDETRVRILKFLSINGECCVCNLESAFEMIQSRLSRHLKILKEAGFLRVRRDGRWAYYSIRSPLDEFRQAALKEILSLQADLLDMQNACENEL
ncbi:transcriptional regulator, ArsR family [Campylobacter iguaniorum]|uniref:ArsR/SmtB family transcription factor n=1 Tax=Campylobacter iguaniorum TaxID=1244531 RepID=UPI0007C899DB|nr:metalloregulator ArsR/SmtB family transcription factor [Campylobacter iguaniorum]ANE36272.1 transcriptional regulator, ArsR family [Campylobacter iguaniorum]